MHPDDALFSGEKQLPTLSACEHFAGSEKLIYKAMALQRSLGPIFDVTCDCEDGARIGEERAHAMMVADAVNAAENEFGKVGVRIHDPSHACWRQDVDVIVGAAAQRLAYVTIPKAVSCRQLSEVVEYVQQTGRRAAGKSIPIHVLIETHGALEEIGAIARLPNIEVFDFGQMDFVSGHLGAIPASAMRSPGQFEHALLVRAKARLVATALAHGIVPAHNVCMSLDDAGQIASDAMRARTEFGFQRMWSIHPFQIEPIVRAMQPDLDEVAEAAEILLAAQAADWGPIRFAGELHDRATYRYFWSLLRKARAMDMALDGRAVQRFFPG